MSKNITDKLSVKNDFVFKKIFTKKGNEEFLKEFLSELLSIKIEKIEIAHDIVLEKNLQNEKLGVLDIKATLNNNIHINIEMQRCNEKNIIKRSTYYAAKIISGQLNKKENYKILKPVVVIFIMDFNYFNSNEYITKTIMVSNEHREYEVNDNMIYYFVELPKLRNYTFDLNDKLMQWLIFIDGENKVELEKIIKSNNLIKRANDELEYLTGNDEMKRLAELREKYVREIEIAKSDGFEDGEKNEKIKITKKLLKRNLDIKSISEIIELSEDEINTLNN